MLMEATEAYLANPEERKENEPTVPAHVALELQKINEATSLIYHSLTNQAIKFSYPCFDTEVVTLTSEEQAITDLENILADI